MILIILLLVAAFEKSKYHEICYLQEPQVKMSPGKMGSDKAARFSTGHGAELVSNCVPWTLLKPGDLALCLQSEVATNNLCFV